MSRTTPERGGGGEGRVEVGVLYGGESDTRWRGIFVLAESLNGGRWTWRGIDFLSVISRTSYDRAEISGRRGGGEIVGRWVVHGQAETGLRGIRLGRKLQGRD